MAKAPLKLTRIQSKALEFIRTSVNRSGTAPTLRELCSHMGYSAIGSAQDLVAALRKKGYLQTPDRQSARSLVLTPKALALHEPQQISDETTYLVPCFEEFSGNIPPLQKPEERVDTLRLSVSMFSRPYPVTELLFAMRAIGDSMIDAGIYEGDWLVFQAQEHAVVNDLVLVRFKGELFIRRMLKDRNGWYLRAENLSYSVIRFQNDGDIPILGKVIALQRVFQNLSTL